MDELVGLLDGPRARSAFLLRCVMSPPWSLRVMDEAPLTVMAIASGSAWIVPDEGDPVRLGMGDVAVARGPGHYIVADHPGTPPDVEILADQVCVTPNGRPMAEAMSLGVRSWGNDPEGDDVMIVGTYESMGDVSHQLMRALPPVLSLAADDWDCPLVPLLCEEVVRDAAGQGAVLDRLLDLVLIAALRAWFARPEAEPPAWYQAQSDPTIGHALRLMDNNPSHPWTVANLAREIGMSRAAFARRFNDLVGEPPMTYLTNTRLALAADLLHEPRATVGSVAAAVGYSTPFSLSAAFKRVRGVTPTEHRSLVTSPL
ncbi:MAG: AraC family transcriptional regulator [Acidimicrobiales bacterium]